MDESSMDDTIATTTTSTCDTDGCPTSWIGDQACDLSCIDCAYFYDSDGLFDGGDCEGIRCFKSN